MAFAVSIFSNGFEENFTKKKYVKREYKLEGVNNTGPQPFLNWPQFFKFEMPTVKISNMIHFTLGTSNSQN